MGEQERLSPEVVAQPTLLAAEHVHRYRLGAELCRGARVLDLGCGTGYGSRILRAESSVGHRNRQRRADDRKGAQDDRELRRHQFRDGRRRGVSPPRPVRIL